MSEDANDKIVDSILSLLADNTAYSPRELVKRVQKSFAPDASSIKSQILRLINLDIIELTQDRVLRKRRGNE